jgi:hypothetical protein
VVAGVSKPGDTTTGVGTGAGGSVVDFVVVGGDAGGCVCALAFIKNALPAHKMAAKRIFFIKFCGIV